MGLRPGAELLEKDPGGLKAWMKWPHAMLTDSGGFQMVSLLSLSELSEDGVTFKSPYDGLRLHLRPEDSMRIQNAIGADIIMQLDDVVNPLSPPERIEEAMYRSIRWLDRCIASHSKKGTQALFPIVQGGLNARWRRHCAKEMCKRECEGYAIGGLCGGEDKEAYCEMVNLCTDLLPADRPRYCMGIGYATDLVVSTALGADMYDCVYPTRTARFGNALTRHGVLNLKQSQYASDLTPIDSTCGCPACTRYTRAFLHHAVTKETAACHLLSVHNLTYQMTLMNDMRNSILADDFETFLRRFLSDLHGDAVPGWVLKALRSVNIEL